MATRTEVRAARPPLEGAREAPFFMRALADSDGPDDGLTLDGYGAVFNRLTTIDSWEGRFREQFAPKSMARSFRETPPKIQFDHGRHPLIGSIPIASLRSISEDVHPELAPEGGAHIVARIFDNWLMQPVRDAISEGAINGMSHRFGVVREAWTYADGKPIRDERALMTELERAIYDNVEEDDLPIRTVKEARILEMGPVVWPAYTQTSVGVRSTVIDLGRLREGDPEQRRLLAEAVFIADSQDEEAQRDTTTELQVAVVERPAESANEVQRTYDQAAAAAGKAAAKAFTAEVAPRTSTPNDAQQGTPECVAERPSQPRRLSNKDLQLRNQRDRLLTLRNIGERSQ